MSPILGFMRYVNLWLVTSRDPSLSTIEITSGWFSTEWSVGGVVTTTEVTSLLQTVQTMQQHIKGKRTNICIVLHSQKLTTEALRYGPHSYYAANTPYLPYLVSSPLY